jgi:hypothetical protein
LAWWAAAITADIASSISYRTRGWCGLRCSAGIAGNQYARALGRWTLIKELGGTLRVRQADESDE